MRTPIKTAMMYGRLRQWDRVADNLEVATALSPELAEAFGRLGFAYARLNRLEEAEAALQRARQLGLANDPQINATLREIQERRLNR